MTVRTEASLAQHIELFERWDKRDPDMCRAYMELAIATLKAKL